MLYFGNPSSQSIRDAVSAGLLGVIDTPGNRRIIQPDWAWCADNGCFGKGYPGDEGYLRWLGTRAHVAENCRFATAPDVLGNASATLERSASFFGPIASLGYIPALVAQDGLEASQVPWSDIGAIFLGGTTDWKLGASAAQLVAEAKARGKWAHMGRVNSRKRLRYAHSIGCDSVDGTFLAYGPDVNLPPLLRWLAELEIF